MEIMQLAWNGVTAGSLYSLYAASFFIIFGVTGTFHFAHGGVYIIGGYLIWVMSDYLSLPMAVSMILVLAISSCIGLIFEIWVYRPLRKIGASPMILLISSMGALIVLQNVLPLIFGYEVLRLHIPLQGKTFNLKYASITHLELVIVIINVLVITLMALFLKYTTIGKAIRAVQENVLLAEVVGVNIKMVNLVCFGIGSLIIGLAASIHTMDIGIHSYMGFQTILIAAVAVILGGMGSLAGAVLGAFVIGLVQDLGVWKISSVWQNTIVFGLLYAFIVVRPRGFFGKKMTSSEI